jgi:N-acetylglutamate synthase-like GNAT family acetyltransferase
VRIRPAQLADEPALARFLERWNALSVARRGMLERPLEHGTLVAVDDGRLVAVLAYVIRGTDCEVMALYVDEPRRGIGTALLDEVGALAEGAGCSRLWLVTTNDNLDALRFYQRRGFRLAALRPGAVVESRVRLKPTIPATGSHGIPLRDELELERELGPSAGRRAPGSG